jgi:hypothetical protein
MCWKRFSQTLIVGGAGRGRCIFVYKGSADAIEAWTEAVTPLAEMQNQCSITR